MATADSKVNAGKSVELDVQLQITTVFPGAGVLGGIVNATGEVTNQFWSAPIQGQLELYNPEIVPGLYNIVFSPFSDPSAGPGGYSFASATVYKTGGVTLVLTPADGTTSSSLFFTSLTQDDLCPIYGSLYGGKGVIIGALQFASDGSRTVANNGNINWVKLPVNDRFYINGFSYTGTASGGIYEPLNIFNWTAGDFDVDPGYSGLNLADDTGGVAVTFNPTNNTFADTNSVSLSLAPDTGYLTGSFKAATFNLQTNAGATPSFKGVINGDSFWGFYSSTNQETGPVVIQAVPPVPLPPRE
jgi:hypothetical protein